MEEYLFSIPIYNSSSEKYYQNYKEKKDKYVSKTIYNLDNNDPRFIEKISNQFELEYFKPWRYNNIIGWVKLFMCGYQLRCEVSINIKERIGKKVVKDCIQMSHDIIIFGLENKHSSDEIRQILFKQLLDLQNDDLIKHNFLDLSEFEIISKYIDWKNLLNDKSKKN